MFQTLRLETVFANNLAEWDVPATKSSIQLVLVLDVATTKSQTDQEDTVFTLTQTLAG